MVLTVSQVIELRSVYVVDLYGDITTDELEALQIMAVNRLNTIIGIRSFNADELTEMTALIILDYLQNRPGHGATVSETVTDSTWRNKGITTSSQWLDEVYMKIMEYDNNQNTSAGCSGVAYRDDTHIDNVIDGAYEAHVRGRRDGFL